MKLIIPIFLSVFFSPQLFANDFLGSWAIEEIKGSPEQFPIWLEIKYPRRLTVFEESGVVKFTMTDQYGYECSGVPLLTNHGADLVFAYCSGLGTKNPEAWSPIHHAKIIDGEIHGVVSSNQYLFKWVGARGK